MAEASFQFSVELLREYSEAALKNAGELLAEASLLLNSAHSARAYFLAVASIEETGKALQAFDAQGRNLADSAVTAQLRRGMENHSQKITAALSGILIASKNIRKDVMPIVDLMVHLKEGREPSMYTDIRCNDSKVLLPASLVRPKAAQDCVRLAAHCLEQARKHIGEKKPEMRSEAEDQFFAMKAGQFQKMANTEGFWWYWISQLEQGCHDFAAAAVRYHREYFAKGKTYVPPHKAT